MPSVAEIMHFAIEWLGSFLSTSASVLSRKEIGSDKRDFAQTALPIASHPRLNAHSHNQLTTAFGRQGQCGTTGFADPHPLMEPTIACVNFVRSSGQ